MRRFQAIQRHRLRYAVSPAGSPCTKPLGHLRTSDLFSSTPHPRYKMDFLSYRTTNGGLGQEQVLYVIIFP